MAIVGRAELVVVGNRSKIPFLVVDGADVVVVANPPKMSSFAAVELPPKSTRDKDTKYYKPSLFILYIKCQVQNNITRRNELVQETMAPKHMVTEPSFVVSCISSSFFLTPIYTVFQLTVTKYGSKYNFYTTQKYNLKSCKYNRPWSMS